MKKSWIGFPLVYFFCFIANANTPLMSSTEISKTNHEGFYFDAGLGLLNIKLDNQALQMKDQVDIDYVTASIGYKANSFLAFEARMAGGVDEKSTHASLMQNGATVTTNTFVDVNNMLGAYVRAELPKLKIISPYFIAGFSRGSIRTRIPSISFEESKIESDISYGGGLKLHLSEKYSVTLEFLSYLNKKEYKLRGINLSASIPL